MDGIVGLVGWCVGVCKGKGNGCVVQQWGAVGVIQEKREGGRERQAYRRTKRTQIDSHKQSTGRLT